jgi:polyisoprenyl-phosphate glycosyltransferase
LTMRAASAGHPLVSRRRVEISVVIPVYGCRGTLRPLHAHLSNVLPSLSDRYEIIFVDDRAGDGSWPILQELAQADQHVIACRLSRNFGQQIAITAGLEQSSGDYVVVMDCDLQDPPEVIAELVASVRRGFDIVFAKRKSTYRSPFRTIAGRLYFRLLGLLSGCRIDEEVGAFSIISLAFRERDRHYLMILRWLGFEATMIEYDRAARTIGRSTYSLGKLINFGLAGMFFTTTRLLHWVIYVGLALAGSGFLLALYFVLRWFAYGAVPGWTSLIVVQLVVGGLISLCVGVAALYIGKIFEASQQRPLYVVQDKVDGHELAEARESPTTVRRYP